MHNLIESIYNDVLVSEIQNRNKYKKQLWTNNSIMLNKTQGNYLIS